MSESPRAEEISAPSGFGRLLAAVQNGIEIARFGGVTEREPAPYALVTEASHHRLRHYYPDAAGVERSAVLLVPPLMLSAEVWDVDPDSSAVRTLHAHGADPWVVDFGSPEQEEGGLDRTLSDHVLAVSAAIDAVRDATGRDVHVMGYSQGGMFAYQAAAYRHSGGHSGGHSGRHSGAHTAGHSDGVASLVTFGSPVDLHNTLPINLPGEMLGQLVERWGELQSSLMPEGLPSWVTRLGFQLMDPVKTLRQRVEFVLRLYDREALQRRDGMRRFLNREGWVAFPGPALADLMEQLVAHNRLLQGGFVIDERLVTLADLTCPILAFVGSTDTIAPPPAVRAIAAATPRARAFQAKIPAGHFGLVVGSRSTEITWPTVAQWLAWCEGRGPLPERATPLDPRMPVREPTAADQIASGAFAAWNLGRELVEGTVRQLESRAGVAGRLARAVAPQLPRLARLAQIRGDTRVSLGRALEERAQQAPEDTFFLFEGRAHSYAAANTRVDNIVRGFLRCGVRHGQHVGVLMDTRPSAVAATVALSRLGAVAVLLRPDAALERQLALAPVDHLVADPEHGEAARAAFGREVLVLGGGGDPRTLAPGLLDMEAIDPDRVWPPDWYRPNPGVAAELALVLITGDGDRLGVSRISNRRWATSAYGTASGCALTSGDTVYCCSPTHHATGILVCVGGALVSGARLAMATRFAPTLDPELFWDDVRRYAVNVVFYTGAMCGGLVNAPPSDAERNHPVRLFAGSGMPKGIWKRVVERFRPARVVEFFATTEGNAVLVNLTGEKIGSLGQPLPGAAELRLAAFDLHARGLVRRRSGFAARAKPGEVGLLLAREDPERGELAGRPLRGVFEPGDAWLDTRDLVRRDADGDYWLVDHVSDLIRTASGAVPSRAVEDVLGDRLDFIDLVAVYGVPEAGGDSEIPVAAITLRANAKLDPDALRHVIESALPGPQRPRRVRVLDALPMTAGHRVRKRVLREQPVDVGEVFGPAPDADG